LPRFSVQKPGPYHPFGRIRIAPFGKGVLRILGESGYTNGLLRSAAHPFLYYLISDEERSPHPLLDVQYLAEQYAS
jgi:hypothetical protein